jgi:uncharacterized membrane protein
VRPLHASRTVRAAAVRADREDTTPLCEAALADDLRAPDKRRKETEMIDLGHPLHNVPQRDRWIVLVGAIAGGAILLALVHGIASGAVARSSIRNLWLALHLASVIPALPLGAYVLLRRKGDRVHRTLGKLWALLMLLAATSSFGLRGMNGGGLSVIHLLSLVVLIMIPRGVWLARRNQIEAHRRTMSLTYLGLAVAGLFTLVPGRLLGSWLYG